MGNIGAYQLELNVFKSLTSSLESLKNEKPKERLFSACRLLLTLINQQPAESFLLAAVIDYIEKINQSGFLQEEFTFALFEYWLNQKSGLSLEENLFVRSKISGKKIPRSDYQHLFPIGLGNFFAGSHFVIAHKSPDIDTTVASFWGWLDAFSAKVGTGLHYWSLPGKTPSNPVSNQLKKCFGQSFFQTLAKDRPTIALTALDLVTGDDVEQVLPHVSIKDLDLSKTTKAILVVDDQGNFLGDWHASDREGLEKVTQEMTALFHCPFDEMELFLMDLFSGNEPTKEAIYEKIHSLFKSDSLELTKVDRTIALGFFQHILHVDPPFTFERISTQLVELQNLRLKFIDFANSNLFDDKGFLQGNRQEIFSKIKLLIQSAKEDLVLLRSRLQQVGMAIEIKKNLLKITAPQLTQASDVEEIRVKMNSHDFLTVTLKERPLGVVYAKDVRLESLGTVSYRDFCNQEEASIASYLRPISVIDHHKSILSTRSPPTALIADTQSANVLLAEIALMINERYSTLGMTHESIEMQLADATLSPGLKKRLLQRKIACQTRGGCFIDPKREFAEYLFFLLAILDDTDLFSKVTARDVRAACELLNRMKTLLEGKETLLIDLNSLSGSEDIAKEGANILLKNNDLYSIYRTLYEAKSEEIKELFESFGEKNLDALFSDTKEQNGCVRVGQIKLFIKNRDLYLANREKLMQVWQKISEQIANDRTAFDLHLLMISTVADAEEVYTGQKGNWGHQDELWIWIPSTESGKEHLTQFLNAFQSDSRIQKLQWKLELLGNDTEWLKEIFERNFLSLTKITKTPYLNGVNLACLYFEAGALNSRKAMISPYLPKIIS